MKPAVNMAAGPFTHNYVPHQKITPPTTHTQLDHDVANALEFARQLMPLPLVDIIRDRRYDYFTVALTSHQLELFLAASKAYEHEPHYTSVIGLVATKLIQTTHNHGVDQFYVDLSGLKPLPYFGCELKPQEGRNLEVVVKGSLGEDAFCNATGKYYVEHVQGSIGARLQNGIICVKDIVFWLDQSWSVCKIDRENDAPRFFFWDSSSKYIVDGYSQRVLKSSNTPLHKALKEKYIYECHVHMDESLFAIEWEEAIPYIHKLEQLFPEGPP